MPQKIYYVNSQRHAVVAGFHARRQIRSSQSQSMSVPMCVSTVRRAPTRSAQPSTWARLRVGPVRASAQEAADDPGVDAIQRRERRVVQATTSVE